MTLIPSEQTITGTTGAAPEPPPPLIENVPMCFHRARRIVIFPLDVMVTHLDLKRGDRFYVHTLTKPRQFSTELGLPIVRSGAYSIQDLHVLWGRRQLPHISLMGGCLALGENRRNIENESHYLELKRRLTEAMARIELASLLTRMDVWPEELRQSIPTVLRKAMRFHNYTDAVIADFFTPVPEAPTWQTRR